MTPTNKILSLASAGMLALVVFSGCKKSAAHAVVVAPAAAPAPVAVALQLAPSKQLKKGIDAMPELANASTPAMQKINATMQNLDSAAISALKDCKSYQKSVKPTMLGPGYFSVWMNESYDCGAYPSVNISVVLFDLNTGAAVDWMKMVNGTGTSLYSDTGADGKNGSPQALIYPALLALYLKEPDNAGDCATAYQDPQSFMIWPEAASGTLMVEAFDLPHVTQACANDMKLTLDQAKALGFNADFLAAVAAAHNAPGAAALTSTN